MSTVVERAREIMASGQASFRTREIMWSEAMRQADEERQEQERASRIAACKHTFWSYDDTGNHWCQDCPLSHFDPSECSVSCSHTQA